ncbi:MAG: aminopeptidase P family protein [Clostridium sp.]|nr:aminopeptidase P family protein [Clostridium sp.]
MNRYYMDRLVEGIRKTGWDAMLLSPGEELNFLMDFAPTLCERFQGLFVRKDGKMFYICNLLYAGEFRKLLPEEIAVYPWFDGEVMTDVVRDVLTEQGLIGGVIGVNSTAQGFNLLEIMDKVDVTFKNGKPLLEKIRAVKNAEELQHLRESAAIADEVFGETIKFIRRGMTEKEIGDFMGERMVAKGGYAPWVIVGVGENSSYPHYAGTDGVVQDRDIVLLDFGCIYKGLYSDTTRTVFVGEPTEHQKEVYDLVKRSNEAAEEMVCLGVYIPDIDRKAREILDEKGYAKTLINRVGHGIGYMIHEQPEIKQSNPGYLEKGNAFSIEPGIYLAGDFGVRIEDIVIINEKGEREILNKTTKDMIIL